MNCEAQIPEIPNSLDCGHDTVWVSHLGAVLCQSCFPYQRSGRTWAVKMLDISSGDPVEIEHDAQWAEWEHFRKFMTRGDGKYLRKSPPKKCRWCHRTVCSDVCMEIIFDGDYRVPFGGSKDRPIREMDNGFLKWLRTASIKTDLRSAIDSCAVRQIVSAYFFLSLFLM